MINTTLNEIVFNWKGENLHEAVRECVRKTALGLLELNELSEADLDRISTKTVRQALYSKLVFKYVLPSKTLVFDEAYVSTAYELYQHRLSGDARKFIYYFLNTTESLLEFRAGYQHCLPTGVGLFLVALHSSGAITLPISFNWPKALTYPGKRGVDPAKRFASELIGFIKSLDTQSTDISDPAFMAVGTEKKRREWFGCYATKLLVATGWHGPSDANVDDLVKLKRAVDSNGTSESVTFPFSLLVDVLWRKYGNGVRLTPEIYRESAKTDGWSKRSFALEDRKKFAGGDSYAAAGLESVML